MISTNKIQPGIDDSPKPLRVVTSNKVNPKEFNFEPRKIKGVEVRETRPTEGRMVTTADLAAPRPTAPAEVKKAGRPKRK